jgi:hypothetical protein
MSVLVWPLVARAALLVAIMMSLILISLLGCNGLRLLVGRGRSHA